MDVIKFHHLFPNPILFSEDTRFTQKCDLVVIMGIGEYWWIYYYDEIDHLYHKPKLDKQTISCPWYRDTLGAWCETK